MKNTSRTEKARAERRVVTRSYYPSKMMMTIGKGIRQEKILAGA
jgi:hypothetical protein